MPAREYGKGQIRLALVSIPIEVYLATRPGSAFSVHQIHEPSSKRIRYEKVTPGAAQVDHGEIIKDWETSKGS